MRPTLVLLHGSGHRASVWDDVRSHLQTPNVAVDLPGRATRSADLGDASQEAWARSVTADVAASTQGLLVLVGHSAAGPVVPRVATALGPSVVHLVFVAGLIARHGELVVNSFHPEREAAMVDMLDELRTRWRGHSFVFDDEEPPAGFAPLTDLAQLMRLDSMVAMAEPVDWSGVGDDLPRTWVRCSRDRIQPPEFQNRLAANAGATEVPVLDCGHTPALSQPAELAALLDDVAGRYST